MGDYITNILPEILPSFPPAVLGWNVVQGQIPAVDFVHKYEHVFAFKYVSIRPEIQYLNLSHSPKAKRS